MQSINAITEAKLMSDKTVVPVSIDVPVMTQEVFADKIGLSHDTVRGMVERDHLPSIKKGRYRLINIAGLTSDCLQDALKAAQVKN